MTTGNMKTAFPDILLVNPSSLMMNILEKMNIRHQVVDEDDSRISYVKLITSTKTEVCSELTALQKLTELADNISCRA